MLDPPFKSCTWKFSKGIAKKIKSPIKVAIAFDPSKTKPFPPHKQYWAIWDTGATNSVISSRVISDLGLKPIGIVKASSADKIYNANTYLVNFVLPNQVGIPLVRVTEGRQLIDAGVLIGMDIISKGDFAVTNYKGKTVFSFRIPSSECIDFSIQKPTPIKLEPQQGRNSRCSCGSGKKYKRCCGK